MKRVLIVFLVLSALSTVGQISPQSKKITKKFFSDSEHIKNVTPALQKKKGYTNYKELLTFLNNITAQHPQKTTLTFIGKSQKGKKIPMIRLTNSIKKDKIKVWIQGGLHGNEMASTETMLYLINALLNDPLYSNLLEDLDITIVPMANIDGYLKKNRYASNGLDLNRDQTKLMAPESVVLKKAFVKFNPEVALDFHEYRPYRKDFARFGDFGITALYDAMFLYSGNLNVPENLRHLTDTLFVENARKVLDKHNFKHHAYMSTGKFNGEIHFNQGSSNARSSATNFALSNTISSLIEIRGVGLGKTSFKRRINTAFLIAISYLKTTATNKNLVKKEIEKAENQQNNVIVTSKKTVSKNTIQAIDLDTNEITDLKVTIRDALKSMPKIVRKRPRAYIIKAAQKEIIEKLKILGADLEILSEDVEINVQIYTVSKYKRNEKKYEKMNQQVIETILSNDKIMFNKGDYKVSMNQKRANIIIEVLEPEAPNSFVSFGVLKTTKNAVLPIYRILN